MAKKLTYSIDLTTRDAIKSLGKLDTAAADTEQGFDDVESAGKQMARAIGQSADNMIAEIDDTARAVKALDRALGPDFDGDTRDVVASLKKVGLTADDVEQDADELAAALRRAGDVKTHAAVNGFDDVGQAVGSVRDETGRARDTMTGFIGGTVGELPGISDAMGPVAEGLGQVAEGALSGEISMRQLAAAGIGMAAVAVVVQQIAGHFADVAAVKAFNAAEVEEYADALEDADNTLDAVIEKLKDAEGVKINVFGDDIDLTETINDVGLSVSQFAELVEGGQAKWEEWETAALDAGVSSQRVALVLHAVKSNASALSDALEGAAVAAEFFAPTQDDVNRAVAEFIKLADPVAAFRTEFDRMAAALANGVSPAVDDVQTVMAGLNIDVAEALDLADEHREALADEAEALGDVADEAEDAADGVSGLTDRFEDLKDELSDRSAYLGVQDELDRVRDAALKAYAAGAEGADDADDAARDYEQTMIGLKQKVIDYGTEIDGLPEQQITKILTAIDQGSFDQVARYLADLERIRYVQVRYRTGALPFAPTPAGLTPATSPNGSRSAGFTRTVAPVTNIYVGAGQTAADISQLANRQARRNGVG